MVRGTLGRLTYPGGKRFAFTILDDCDDSTIEKVRPIYDFLTDLGFRTTKTVWPVGCPEGSEHFFAAETLEDAEYREYALELARRGFEITWHGATMESSKRERTLAGLEAFKAHLGAYPDLHCNHGWNQENLYWGRHRYRTPFLRPIMGSTDRRRTSRFCGEDPESEYFWGDLCRQHFRYVRNLTFPTINTLAADPHSPYRRKDTPFVRCWFSTSDAEDVHAFNRLVTRESIGGLAAQGGICILSTHLGKGFCRDGSLDPEFVETMTYLSQQDGWFVPVSEVLDHLVANGRGRERSRSSMMALEFRHVGSWLRAKLRS